MSEYGGLTAVDSNYNFPPPVRAAMFQSEEFTNATKDHLVVNVMDYGATGNGTTDDWAKIKDAVDAVNLNGGTLHFPRPPVAYNIVGYSTFAAPGPSQFGRYAFLIKSNVTVTGEAGAILMENIDYNNRRVMFYVEGSNVSFRGLSFWNTYNIADGSRPTAIPIGGGDGFNANFAGSLKDIRITECNFSRAWHPVKFNLNKTGGTATLDNIVVDRCISRGEPLSNSSGGYNCQAIPAGRVTNFTVVNSQVYDVSVSAAIGYYGVHGGSISNNMTARSGIDGGGIQLENGSKNISITANQGYDHFNHIWLDDSSEVTATSNICHNSTPGVSYKGIRITKQGYTEVPNKIVTGIKISDNILTNCYIAVENFSTPQGSPTFGVLSFENNDIYLNGTTNNYGFNLNEGCTRLKLATNYVIGAAVASIRSVPIANQRSIYMANITEKFASEASVGLLITNANNFRPQLLANEFINGVSLTTAQAMTMTIGNTRLYTGIGTPEGSVSGPPGSMYFREDGGTGTSVYVKESGTSFTGWVAK